MTWTPTRRTFLKTTAVAAGAAAVGSSGGLTLDTLCPRSASAATTPGRLVVVFLRGGQDHLSTVVPYTEAAYYDARPTIAIPANQVLALNAQFGFHPALTQLHSMFQQGRVAVVVAAGNPAGNRSHFTAQDLWEAGSDNSPQDGSGWLGRYLAATSADGDAIFRGLAVGNNVARSLRGYPAMGMASIESFGLGGVTNGIQQLGTLLRHQYTGNKLVEKTGIGALDAVDLVGTVSGSNAQDDVTRAFADLAILLEADLGIEVATVNIGGWDTHESMGTAAAGVMRNLLAGLDGYLGAFYTDLDARGQTDVTTVVMTEFGRRVAENGTKGTDHGFACVMLVVGDAVNGGVYGNWLGLSPGVIGARGDVVPTVDFRNVLGDYARDVLGVTNPSSLFPGHGYQPVGVTG